jgi:prolipoprotein diacylglyceryltransferase
MFPIVQIGPLAIPAPALLILIGVWVGLSASEKYAPRLGVDAGRLNNVVLIALLAGLVGSRLAYVARFPSAFAGSLLAILTPRPVMLDLSGGLLVGGLAALIYAQRKNMQVRPVLDALVPGLAVFMIFFGLSRLASGEAFGQPTDLPWAIYLWGEYRHPTQVYEIIAALLTAIYIWRRLQRPVFAPGSLFLAFTAISAAFWIVVETFRGDSLTVMNGLRVAQMAAWLVLAFSLWQLDRLRTDRTQKPAAS